MPILTSLALGSTRGFGFAAGGSSFIVQSFNESGIFLVPTGITEIEYLVVAGGGGSGGSMGGGGAGGLRFGSKYPVTPASTYTVTVGGGGSASSSPWAPGTGSGSSIEGGSPVTHLGTNGGGVGAPSPYSNGGSGGGANSVGTKGTAIALTPANGHSGSLPDEDTSRGTNVQGFDGGSYTLHPSPVRGTQGGGGGASEAGQTGDATNLIAGNGGKGIVSEISGSSRGYGGGGGGSTHQFSPPNPNSRTLGGNSFTDIGAPYGGGNGGRTDDPSAAVTSGIENTGGGAGSGEVGRAGGSGFVAIKFETEEPLPLIFEGSGETIIPSGVSTIDYFVLSGGGAGGHQGGGGGGGGGVRLGTGLPVSKDQILTVTVGAGGTTISVTDPGNNPTDFAAQGRPGSDSFVHIAPIGTVLGSNGGGGGGSGPGGNAPYGGTGYSGGTGGGAGGKGIPASQIGGSHSRTPQVPPTPPAKTPYTPNSAPAGSLSAIPGETLTYTQQGYDGGGMSNGGFGEFFTGGGGGAGGAGVNGIPPSSDFADNLATSHGGIGVFTNMSGTTKGYGGGGGGGTPSDYAVPARPGIVGVGGAGPYTRGTAHPTHGASGTNYPGGTSLTGFYGGGNGVSQEQHTGTQPAAPTNSGVSGSGGGGGGGHHHPTENPPYRQAHAGNGGSGVIIIKFNV